MMNVIFRGRRWILNHLRHRTKDVNRHLRHQTKDVNRHHLAKVYIRLRTGWMEFFESFGPLFLLYCDSSVDY
jgi:hypothetical protein